jgi:UDPglucose 6-dehydrogenase
VTAVSVVGLGKLGACLAAAIASKGHEVVGVDLDPEVVEAVNAGRAPVPEPGLDALIAASRPRLRATADLGEAVLASDLTFIAVPTPSEESGAFSLRHVRDAVAGIGRALRRKEGYHLVVLTSTVLPGASDAEVVPLLEAESGRRVGRDFGYCYSPEFIALGSVIRDFLHPDFVLIGEGDERAGDALQAFYESVLERQSPFARMSCANAELTKLAVNTYVTMKISFANTMAELCERLPGGDVDAVTGAIGLDSRIGRRYLSGALPYGGPCFPHDNRALAHLASGLGVAPLLAEATDAVNREQARRLLELLEARLRPGATVAVLGLAYKPGTQVVDEAPGLLLAQELALRGYRAVLHDPLANGAARALLGEAVAYAGSPADAIAAADAVVIANPDPSFAALRAADFPARKDPVLVLDCWRLLRDELSTSARVRYVGVGLGEGGTLP